MNYRKLGNTDLMVSEIGFGCQSIGGGLYYKNDRESLKTLLEAFDLGVNFFDTSDHYSQGESEKLIGKAFKGKRDKIIIGTKGILWIFTERTELNKLIKKGTEL